MHKQKYTVLILPELTYPSKQTQQCRRFTQQRLDFIVSYKHTIYLLKVKQSRYRPEVAQRVPGS
jgi:hypothetical protein